MASPFAVLQPPDGAADPSLPVVVSAARRADCPSPLNPCRPLPPSPPPSTVGCCPWNPVAAQVLLGWVGTDRDGPLLKYAELLAAHGYCSCRSVQPVGTAFSLLERPRRQWAQSLLAFLEEQRLWPQRRLVLYAFSNGGAFVVEQLLLLAERDPRCAGAGRWHRAVRATCIPPCAT